jgi:membrane associated rhomboid family serine protease
VLSVIPIFFFLPIIYVPAWVMLGAWFGLQLIQGYTSIGGQTDVAFFAHIGGFLAGLLLVWVFTTPKGRSQRPAPKRPRARS